MGLQWDQVWPVVTLLVGQASALTLDWRKDKRQARRERAARVHAVDERWHEFELGKLMEINDALAEVGTKLPAYIRERRANSDLSGVSLEVSALTLKITTLSTVLPDEELRMAAAEFSTAVTGAMVAPLDLENQAASIVKFTRTQTKTANQIGERIRQLHTSLVASAERGA